MRKFWIVVLIAGIALVAVSAFQYLTRLGSGDAAPDFALATAEGAPVKLSDFRGKPVLLHFFATWCGPCQAEFPTLKPFQEKLADTGLTVLAVSEDEDRDALVSFIESLKPAFPVLVDEEGLVAESYQSWALPETFLIGPDGVIRWRHTGPLDWSTDEAQSKARSLIAK